MYHSAKAVDVLVFALYSRAFLVVYVKKVWYNYNTRI